MPFFLNRKMYSQAYISRDFFSPTKICLLIFLTLFSSTLLAQPVEDQHKLKKHLAIPLIKNPLINEIVAFDPVPEHHFNLAAPQSCGEQATIDASARKIICQFHTSGEKNIVLSICDNNKKYCKQERHKVQVQERNSETQRMGNSPPPETLKAQTKIHDLLLKSFHVITPKESQIRAKNKKGILVLVSTDWCPPCNTLKEFLLTRPEFMEATKDYLLVYVDGEGPLSKQWANYTRHFFYPSFVFLNKNLDVIGAQVDQFDFFAFKSWLSNVNALSEDSIEALKKRIDTRISGSWLRRVLDYFIGSDDILNDQRRLIDWLLATNESTKAITYMHSFSPENYKWEILNSQYESVRFGEKSTQYTDTEKNKILRDLAIQLLEGPAEKITSYASISLAYCGPGNLKQEKFTKCKTYLNKLTEAQKLQMRENQDLLLPHEKVLRKLDYLSLSYNINSALGKKTNGNNLLAECKSELNILEKFTPLGEKSRSIRLSFLSCISDYGNDIGSISILQSLIKDYPCEETFRRKLAQKYLSINKYDEALLEVDKAIKFAYGDMWINNILLKARIFKAKGNARKAFELLKHSLKEISLEQNLKDNWWLKNFRKEYLILERDVAK